MPFHPTADSLVRIATSGAGPFINLKGILTYATDEGAEDDEETFTFGDPIPITDEGADVTALSLTGLKDMTDSGQNMVRSARVNGTTVFLQLLHDGANGEQQEFRVARKSVNADRNGGTGAGKFVGESYDLRSVGPITNVVAP